MSNRGPFVLVCLLLVALATGCPSDGGGSSDGGKVVATVGDETITLAELEAEARGGLLNLDQQRYQLLSTTLNDMLLQRAKELEAESRGMTVAELEAAEIDAKIVNPTNAEVEEWFNKNPSAVGNYSLDDVRSSIARNLREQQRQALQARFHTTVREKYGASRQLEPPRFEVEVAESDMMRGNPSAPLQIVEYADFQCPYCRRAHVVVDRILAEYGNDVNLVFRDYPLNIHARAVPASKAAYCAGEQGKFWDYYDNLMLMTGDLSDTNLLDRAEELEIEIPAFAECYQSDRYDDTIADNTAMGDEDGVRVTPTFFVNGRMIEGVKSFEEWKLILDEELELARSRGA